MPAVLLGAFFFRPSNDRIITARFTAAFTHVCAIAGALKTSFQSRLHKRAWSAGQGPVVSMASTQRVLVAPCENLIYEALHSVFLLDESTYMIRSRPRAVKLFSSSDRSFFSPPLSPASLPTQPTGAVAQQGCASGFLLSQKHFSNLGLQVSSSLN